MSRSSSRSRSIARAGCRLGRRGVLPPLATLALLLGPLTVAHAADGTEQPKAGADKPKAGADKPTLTPSQEGQTPLKKKKKKKKAKVAKVSGYYEMPFPCGESWTGSTRGNHSPSAYSVDWNRVDDVDDVVVASAPGTVTLVSAKDKGGYGKFVQLTHANGEATIYAHLNAVDVSVGQSVDQGTQIGIVGSTGNSTGPHLHYEQRTGASVSPAFFGGRKFAYGSTRVSANCVDVPMAGNVDGTPGAELVVFRRKAWGSFLLQLPSGVQTVAFGLGTDVPVLGDWDGDGKDEVGVRRPSDTNFYLRAADGGVTTIPWGASSDQPVAGDWDGDGKDDIGIFRPGSGLFGLLVKGALQTVTLGDANDIPVAGDWNGDGIDDVGVFDKASAVFTLKLVSGGVTWVGTVQWGQAGDLPVTGDWDGNGTDDLGVWRPVEGTLYQRYATSPRAAARRTASVSLGRPRNTL